MAKPVRRKELADSGPDLKPDPGLASRDEVSVQDTELCVTRYA